MAINNEKVSLGLNDLFKAEFMIQSMVITLRSVGLDTEANDLQAVLDDLVTEREAIQAALMA